MDRPSRRTARLRHTGPVLDRLSRRAYAALGSRYPVAVVGVGVVETVFVAVVSVLVLGLFFRPDLGSVLAVAGLGHARGLAGAR